MALTLGTLKAQVKALVGDQDQVDWTDDNLTQACNRACREAARVSGLTGRVFSVKVLAGASYFDLPSTIRFMAVWRVEVGPPQPDGWVEPGWVDPTWAAP